ncbi:MAG: hypothetical protein GXO75_16140 [Calditrichaeota bacterium]|nr:hypothetical protein [Calditrichota bacterium]
MPNAIDINAINLKNEELRRLLLTPAAFRKTYRNDPAAWIHDIIIWKDGEGPTEYQTEITSEVPLRRRAAIRSPHGAGKTTLAAWLVLWFATTRDPDDWKAPTTASVWRQLEKYLWPEIHKWTKRLAWNKMHRDPFSPAEMLTLALKLSGGEAFAVASDKPDLIEGAHADNLLYLLDEAKAIPDGTWDAVEGAFSGEGSASDAFAVAISTPGPPTGRFYKIHKREAGYEDWWTRHITLDECIKAGRISKEWAEQRRRQWGEDSAVYQNRVLGEFASQSEDSVIPLAWVEAAQERWKDLRDSGKLAEMEIERIGADIARGGGDKTVFAFRSGNVIVRLEEYNYADTMRTTGRLAGLLNRYGSASEIIDVIGIGAGVFDRLNEQFYNRVEAFNAAERTDMRDRSGTWGFVNKRSAAWWNLREMLDPVYGEDVALPDDDELVGDLTAPLWREVSGGKIELEPKDKTKKRLGRSPDKGDAVVMAFYNATVKVNVWI